MTFSFAPATLQWMAECLKVTMVTQSLAEVHSVANFAMTAVALTGPMPGMARGNVLFCTSLTVPC